MAGGRIIWKDDFVGIAYRYYDLRMNVAPLFGNRKEAVEAWHETIRWWVDPTIRLRFVESEDQYWFIAAAESKRPESNTALCRSMPMSENYERFKRGHGGEAYLRLGMYAKKRLADVKDDALCGCGHEAEDHGDEGSEGEDGSSACLFGECGCARFETFQVTLLHKKKTVTDIQFMDRDDARDDALAWNCISAHEPGGRQS